MSNKDWIKDLKVGDKVIIATNNYSNQITSVVKITPKGFINTQNGKQFYPNGSQVGGDSRDFYLLQLTDELLIEFKKNGLVRKCKEIDFSKLEVLFVVKK